MKNQDDGLKMPLFDNKIMLLNHEVINVVVVIVVIVERGK